MLDPKNLWLTKNFGPKSIKVRKNICPKSLLDPDRISCSKNIFGKKLGPKEIWVNKFRFGIIFWSTINSGSKPILSSTKKFRQKKIAAKNFL